MPLAEPTAQPERKPAKFARPQVLEIVQLRNLARTGYTLGNPCIPYDLDISKANVAEGFSLFALNCAPVPHDHRRRRRARGRGLGSAAPRRHKDDGLGGDPDRARATCPGSAPGRSRPSRSIDIVGYVVKDIQHPTSPGGLSLGGVGPVAEGFVGLFVGVGLMLLAALWVGDRNEKTKTEEDHEAERRPRWSRARRARPCLRTLTTTRRVPTTTTSPAGYTIPVSIGAPRCAPVPGGGKEPAAGRAGGGLRLPARGGRLCRLRRLSTGRTTRTSGSPSHLRSALPAWATALSSGASTSCRRVLSRSPDTSLAPTPIEREVFIEDFASRGKVAVERRGLLIKALGLASGVLGVVLAFPLLRSLGPLPKTTLRKTAWRKGSYLVDITGRKIKPADIEVGGFITVFPPDDIGGAYSQTMLIHVTPMQSGYMAPPPEFAKQRATWAPLGFIAFSKLCTHAGCPVGLYEELTERMLCPCHQSVFVVRDAAIPVFGPAPRPLPQLPLYIDEDGYFRAQDGYDEPVGPGYWERGSD